MIDARLERLADILVNYSVAVKPGENVLIQDTGMEIPFARALVKLSMPRGAGLLSASGTRAWTAPC
jgi:aminopeptidase